MWTLTSVCLSLALGSLGLRLRVCLGLHKGLSLMGSGFPKVQVGFVEVFELSSKT